MTVILPLLGKTELQILSVLASALLVGSHATTAYLVKERVLLSSEYLLVSEIFCRNSLDLAANLEHRSFKKFVLPGRLSVLSRTRFSRS